MAGVFDKLNLNDQETVVILNAPVEFEKHIAVLRGVIVRRAIGRKMDADFLLAFVKDQEDVNPGSR